MENSTSADISHEAPNLEKGFRLRMIVFPFQTWQMAATLSAPAYPCSPPEGEALQLTIRPKPTPVSAPIFGTHIREAIEVLRRRRE